MPRPIESSFQRYEFAEEELMAACALSPLQRQFIQNELAVAAERALALQYDPQNPLRFVQEDAGLKGQRAAYEFLLECDRTAQEQAAALLRAQKSESSIPPTTDISSLFGSAEG